MFYLLCVVLCLAVLFIALAGMSAFCLLGARLFRPLVHSSAPARTANRLFGIRILPLLAACVMTFGFALPSFVEFEPRATGEMLSLRLIVLGTFGAFVLVAMVIRAATMVRATMLRRNQWRRSSKKLHLKGVDVPVHCLDESRSVLAVLGIFKPEIFVSREVVQVLSPAELSAAIAHERAHVRSFDNLKQLLLKITRPPRWLGALSLTDAAWINASEVAADEAALAFGASPLDLSAALVKVARLTGRSTMNQAIAASHFLPAVSESSMEARMSHLQELLEDKNSAVPVGTQKGKPRMLFSFGLLVIAYGACVHAALPWVHEALEALVR